MSSFTSQDHPEKPALTEFSNTGMGSDLVIAMNSDGVIMDVSCHHPEIMFAEKSEIIGENFAKFVPPRLADVAQNIMQSASEDEMVQSSFSYCVPIGGVEQDFSCELIGTGKRNSGGFRWLALINTIDDDIKDNWRIRAKNRLLFAVTQASEALMSERGFSEVMNESLYYIGNGIGVDRVYFFSAEYDDGGEIIYMSQKFEWCSNFVEPQIDNPELKRADMSLFTDMWSQLVRDRPFKAIVSKMPDNFTKDILAQQHIKSILTIPVFAKGNLWGMIGFDDCQYERNWKGVDIAILKMFSAIMSARALRISDSVQGD